jgi:hypothetical protein
MAMKQTEVSTKPVSKEEAPPQAPLQSHSVAKPQTSGLRKRSLRSSSPSYDALSDYEEVDEVVLNPKREIQAPSTATASSDQQSASQEPAQKPRFNSDGSNKYLSTYNARILSSWIEAGWTASRCSELGQLCKSCACEYCVVFKHGNKPYKTDKRTKKDEVKETSSSTH